MADKEKVEVKTDAPAKPPTPSGRTIEEYRDELGTDAATFAGVKMRERWPAQKRVTKREYERAVERYLGGPTVAGGGS